MAEFRKDSRLTHPPARISAARGIVPSFCLVFPRTKSFTCRHSSSSFIGRIWSYSKYDEYKVFEQYMNLNYLQLDFLKLHQHAGVTKVKLMSQTTKCTTRTGNRYRKIEQVKVCIHPCVVCSIIILIEGPSIKMMKASDACECTCMCQHSLAVTYCELYGFLGRHTQ